MSYNYPTTRSAGTLVPASDQSSKAVDTASTFGIVQGSTGGRIQGSGAGLAGLVPGSDSFN